MKNQSEGASPTPTQTDNYVAWLRRSGATDDPHRHLVLCDSDSPGAFKVYRRGPSCTVCPGTMEYRCPSCGSTPGPSGATPVNSAHCSICGRADNLHKPDGTSSDGSHVFTGPSGAQDAPTRRQRASRVKSVEVGDQEEARKESLEVFQELSTARERANRVAEGDGAQDAPPTSEQGVCTEIQQIMRVYREQEAAGNVDTPGGLEHMGDVWRLLRRWDAELAKSQAEAKRKSPHAVAMGKKGGMARAKRMSPEERAESARRAVNARWAK